VVSVPVVASASVANSTTPFAVSLAAVQFDRFPLAGVFNAPPLVTAAADATTREPPPVAVAETVPDPVKFVAFVAFVAVAALPVQDPELPVVFWFNVGKVQFAKLPLVGVPSIGVTNVGLVDSTFAPEPVDVVTPVPPLATARVALKPAARSAAAVDICPTFVPSQYSQRALPCGTAIPDPADVLNVMVNAPVVALITRYTLATDGQITA
jgi:hypothetical protein